MITLLNKVKTKGLQLGTDITVEEGIKKQREISLRESSESTV